jgi:ribosomal protein L40E
MVEINKHPETTVKIIICPSCKKPNPGGSEKCNKCGADLTTPKEKP